jgi:CHAT domain-containing protein
VIARKGDPTPGSDAPAAPRALTDVLLPETLREAIRQRKPRRIVLFPDGPLHELPFECLAVSGSGGQPRYLLSEWPPVCYLPSASILAALSRRGDRQTDGLRLLTVGDTQSRTVPPLPGTKTECEQVATIWKERQLPHDVLLGNSATEASVRNALAGRDILHFAAHGVVDRSFENLFGGLLLTDPAQATGYDDGLLSYTEILELPLERCSLAVLSACETNIGTDRPLEASTTLSQAFLSAGVRNVVASQWQVSDKSTALLVAQFLNGASDPAARGDFANALHRSKELLASSSEYSEPFYWAPFVLIGAGH